MDEEIIEEFNERFDTIEAALKYVADSQAKSEFIRKRDYAKHDKDIAEIRELQKQTQRHLDHITKVLRFNIEEYEFQEEKLEKAGEILISKRKK
jgi:ssRNA-specific RNase YbeY (16S rRNA maturation enzyme)